MTGVSFACMAKHKEFSAFQNAYRESPQREEQGRRDRVPESAVSEEWHKHQSEGVDLMPLKGMANLAAGDHGELVEFAQAIRINTRGAEVLLDFEFDILNLIDNLEVLEEDF